MSCIHYKFKSSLDYNSVTFDGLHLSLLDLKKAISQQKRLKPGEFDLEITNAQTGDVYKKSDELIAKNTSVIVSRVPVTRTAASSTQKSWEAFKQECAKVKEKERMMQLEKQKQASEVSAASASEIDKIKAVIDQSTKGFEPSNFVGRTAIPNEHYVCKRCNQKGHFVGNCPNVSAEDRVIEPRYKRTTGIPSTMLTIVDDPLHPGALLTTLGQFAVPTVDVLGYKEVKKERPPFLPNEKQAEPEKKKIPQELLCHICEDLCVDAAIAPCCGTSFCDECLREELLESEDHQCPSCKETNVSPDRIVANRSMRMAVNNFLNDTGYTKVKRRRSSSHSGDAQTTPSTQSSEDTKPAVSTASKPISSSSQVPVVPSPSIQSQPTHYPGRFHSGPRYRQHYPDRHYHRPQASLFTPSNFAQAHNILTRLTKPWLYQQPGNQASSNPLINRIDPNKHYPHQHVSSSQTQLSTAQAPRTERSSSGMAGPVDGSDVNKSNNNSSLTSSWPSIAATPISSTSTSQPGYKPLQSTSTLSSQPYTSTPTVGHQKVPEPYSHSMQVPTAAVKKHVDVFDSFADVTRRRSRTPERKSSRTRLGSAEWSKRKSWSRSPSPSKNELSPRAGNLSPGKHPSRPYTSRRSTSQGDKRASRSFSPRRSPGRHSRSRSRQRSLNRSRSRSYGPPRLSSKQRSRTRTPRSRSRQRSYSPLRRSPRPRSSLSPLSRRLSISPYRHSSDSPLPRKTLKSAVHRSSKSPLRRLSPSLHRSSISPLRRSPMRRSSKSPLRRSSKSPLRRSSKSPLRRSSKSPFRRSSKSPFRRSSKSPLRRSSKSPLRRLSKSSLTRSKSPYRRSSKSPLRRASKSPFRRSSRSPPRRLSKSPLRRSSKSPLRRSSKSPHRRSKSPLRRSSKSPLGRSSKSPLRRSSKSPLGRSSKSPLRRLSTSALRRSSKSPPLRSSKSPRRRSSLSPFGRSSKTPLQRSSNSPLKRYSKSPHPRYSKSPLGRSPVSPRRRSSKSPLSLYRERSRSRSYRRISRSRSKSYTRRLRSPSYSKPRSPYSSFSPRRSPIPSKNRSPWRSPQRKRSLSPYRRFSGSPGRKSPLAFRSRSRSLSKRGYSPKFRSRSPLSKDLRSFTPLSPRRSKSPYKNPLSPLHQRRSISPWRSRGGYGGGSRGGMGRGGYRDFNNRQDRFHKTLLSPSRDVPQILPLPSTEQSGVGPPGNLPPIPYFPSMGLPPPEEYFRNNPAGYQEFVRNFYSQFGAQAQVWAQSQTFSMPASGSNSEANSNFPIPPIQAGTNNMFQQPNAGPHDSYRPNSKAPINPEHRPPWEQPGPLYNSPHPGGGVFPRDRRDHFRDRRDMNNARPWERDRMPRDRETEPFKRIDRGRNFDKFRDMERGRDGDRYKEFDRGRPEKSREGDRGRFVDRNRESDRIKSYDRGRNLDRHHKDGEKREKNKEADKSKTRDTSKTERDKGKDRDRNKDKAPSDKRKSPSRKNKDEERSKSKKKPEKKREDNKKPKSNSEIENKAVNDHEDISPQKSNPLVDKELDLAKSAVNKQEQQSDIKPGTEPENKENDQMLKSETGTNESKDSPLTVNNKEKVEPKEKKAGAKKKGDAQGPKKKKEVVEGGAVGNTEKKVKKIKKKKLTFGASEADSKQGLKKKKLKRPVDYKSETMSEDGEDKAQLQGIPAKKSRLAEVKAQQLHQAHQEEGVSEMAQVTSSETTSEAMETRPQPKEQQQKSEVAGEKAGDDDAGGFKSESQSGRQADTAEVAKSAKEESPPELPQLSKWEREDFDLYEAVDQPKDLPPKKMMLPRSVVDKAEKFLSQKPMKNAVMVAHVTTSTKSPETSPEKPEKTAPEKVSGSRQGSDSSSPKLPSRRVFVDHNRRDSKDKKHGDLQITVETSVSRLKGEAPDRKRGDSDDRKKISSVSEDHRPSHRRHHSNRESNEEDQRSVVRSRSLERELKEQKSKSQKSHEKEVKRDAKWKSSFTNNSEEKSSKDAKDVSQKDKGGSRREKHRVQSPSPGDRHVSSSRHRDSTDREHHPTSTKSSSKDLRHRLDEKNKAKSAVESRKLSVMDEAEFVPDYEDLEPHGAGETEQADANSSHNSRASSIEKSSKKKKREDSELEDEDKHQAGDENISGKEENEEEGGKHKKSKKKHKHKEKNKDKKEKHKHKKKKHKHKKSKEREEKDQVKS